MKNYQDIIKILSSDFLSRDDINNIIHNIDNTSSSKYNIFIDNASNLHIGDNIYTDYDYSIIRNIVIDIINNRGEDDFLSLYNIAINIIKKKLFFSNRKLYNKIIYGYKNNLDISSLLNEASVNLFNMTFMDFALSFNNKHMNSVINVILTNYKNKVDEYCSIKNISKSFSINTQLEILKSTKKINKEVYSKNFPEFLEEGDLWIIYGVSGSGKTVFIDDLLQNSIGFKDFLPLLIDVQELSNNDFQDILINKLSMSSLNNSRYLLNKIVRSKKVLLLFDSLHELDLQGVINFFKIIDKIKINFPKFIIITTTRETLFPFYISNSSLAKIKDINKNEFMDIIKNKNIKINNLIERGDIDIFMLKPFVLNLIYKSTDVDIKNLSSIINNYCKEAIEIYNPLDVYKIYDFLMDVSFYMNRIHKLTINIRDLLKFSNKYEDLLIKLIASGIIERNNVNQIKFKHQLFQDYFSALKLQQNENHEEIDFIYNDYWWDQSIIILSEISNDFNMYLEHIIKYDLLLTSFCMKNMRYINISIINLLIEKSKQAFESEYRLDILFASEVLKILLIKSNIIRNYIYELLKSSDFRKRIYAIKVLEEDKSLESLDKIIYHLENDINRDVRAAAAYTLRKFNNTISVDALANGLYDRDWKVNRFCALSLGYLRCEIHAPKLADRLLRDWNSQTVVWCLYALSRIPLKIAFSAIVNAAIGKSDISISKSNLFILKNLIKIFKINNSRKIISYFLNKRSISNGFLGEWITQSDWADILEIINLYILNIESVGIEVYLNNMNFIELIDELTLLVEKISNNNLKITILSSIDEIKTSIFIADEVISYIESENVIIETNILDIIGELFIIDIPIILYDTVFSKYRYSNSILVGKYINNIDKNLMIKRMNTSNSYSEKISIVRLLSNIHEQDVFTELIKLAMNDQDYYVRWTAGLAISKFPLEEEYIALLNDNIILNKENGLSWWLSYLFNCVNDQYFLDFILEVTKNDDNKLIEQWNKVVSQIKYKNIDLDNKAITFLRRWCLYLMIKIPRAKDSNTLQGLLNHQDQLVRDTIYESLYSIKKRFFIQKNNEDSS